MRRSNHEYSEYGLPESAGFRDPKASKPFGMNRRQVLTRLIALPSVGTAAGCATSSDARYPTKFWDEEVQLADGRIIWVEQGRGFSNLSSLATGIERELSVTLASLKFFLPGISSTVIEWSDRFKPLILNVFNGELFVGGHPFLGRHFTAFKRPRSGWVVQRYLTQSKAWERIPASKTPPPVRESNLLMADLLPAQGAVISLSKKASKDFNGSLGWSPYFRRLDPNKASDWSIGYDDKALTD